MPVRASGRLSIKQWEKAMNKQAAVSVADYIVERLAAEGISHCFGVAGDYLFPICDAVDSSAKVKWIGCAKHKFVNRDGRPEAWEVARVVGMPPETAFGNEAEARRPLFLAQAAILYALQRLARSGVFERPVLMQNPLTWSSRPASTKPVNCHRACIFSS